MTVDRLLLMSEHFAIFLKSSIKCRTCFGVLLCPMFLTELSLSWRLLCTCTKETLVKALNDATRSPLPGSGRYTCSFVRVGLGYHQLIAASSQGYFSWSVGSTLPRGIWEVTPYLGAKERHTQLPLIGVQMNGLFGKGQLCGDLPVTEHPVGSCWSMVSNTSKFSWDCPF